MFALHETTRRGLCRMGFVVLCVLPVCAILAASVWLDSDARQALHERELSQQLGLEVSLDRVVLTQPDSVRYEGIKITDPETGTLLARAASLSLTHRDNTVWVIAVAPELQVERLDDLQDIVTRQLRLGKAGESVRASAERLALHMADNSQLMLDNVRSQFKFRKDAAEARVEFRPVDRKSEEPILVRIVRDRKTMPASVGFEVNTNKSALPCSLVTPFLPAIARLGTKCEFCGDMFGIELPEGWTGELNGKFSNVHLASLTAEQYPGQLAGTAQITIKRAKLASGRIEQMLGELVCRDGYLRHDLAKAMADQLMLSAPKRAKNTFGASDQFSELAFDFALDAEGMEILGRCETKTPGALLMDPTGTTILQTVSDARIPLRAIEDVFSTSRAALMSVLPIPADGARRR